jgi:hypothetical protein
MNRVSLAAVFLTLSVRGAALDAQAVHYEGGLSVASGTYTFVERTTSWTLSNGLALSAGPLVLRGVVPLFRQNTAALTLTTVEGSVLGEAASDETVTATSRPVYELALGDPMAHLSISVLRGLETSLTIGVGAKIPIADTAAYGTGSWDVGGSVSLSRSLGWATLVSIDVSYWHLGDLPELDLRDAVLGSASVAHLLNGGWAGSVYVSGARSVVLGLEDVYYVGMSLNRLSGSRALGITASLGLTETAPDFTVGINWRIGLFGSGP